jgi:hypothetical protein
MPIMAMLNKLKTDIIKGGKDQYIFMSTATKFETNTLHFTTTVIFLLPSSN